MPVSYWSNSALSSVLSVFTERHNSGYKKAFTLTNADTALQALLSFSRVITCAAELSVRMILAPSMTAMYEKRSWSGVWIRPMRYSLMASSTFCMSTDDGSFLLSICKTDDPIYVILKPMLSLNRIRQLHPSSTPAKSRVENILHLRKRIFVINNLSLNHIYTYTHVRVCAHTEVTLWDFWGGDRSTDSWWSFAYCITVVQAVLLYHKHKAHNDLQQNPGFVV